MQLVELLLMYWIVVNTNKLININVILIFFVNVELY